MSIETARITIDRTSADDIGIRQVFISLDGKPFGVLLHGQSVTKEVAAEEHRLRFHNTLVWKNLTVTLAPGEHARFIVTNRAGFGTVALVATLGVGPIYLKIERAPST